MTKHLHIVISLAARPCGTNLRELAERGIPKNTASGLLSNMAAQGRLMLAPGESLPDGLQVHQYFTSEEHRQDWIATPAMERPNMRIRNSSASSTSRGRRALKPQPAVTKMQIGTWARTPARGQPARPSLPGVVVATQSGVSTGHDLRYQINPATFVGGEFTRLGLGRYVDEGAM